MLFVLLLFLGLLLLGFLVLFGLLVLFGFLVFLVPHFLVAHFLVAGFVAVESLEFSEIMEFTGMHAGSQMPALGAIVPMANGGVPPGIAAADEDELHPDGRFHDAAFLEHYGPGLDRHAGGLDGDGRRGHHDGGLPNGDFAAAEKGYGAEPGAKQGWERDSL
jgi:hypothetical protein